MRKVDRIYRNAKNLNFPQIVRKDISDNHFSLATAVGTEKGSTTYSTYRLRRGLTILLLKAYFAVIFKPVDALLMIVSSGLFIHRSKKA
jgi:hypothetical protein